MTGQTVVSGPYAGGLNTSDDPASIGDDQLVISQNWDIGDDGSLVSRPPFVDRGVSQPGDMTSNMRLLGNWIAADGSQYVVGSAVGFGTYWLVGSAWTLITPTVAARAITQFNGKLYLLAPPTASSPGGTWDGTTFVPDSTMPKGVAMVSYKSRLWVAGGTASPYPARVTFSATLGTADASFWTPGPNLGGFFDVNAGDGQGVVSLQVAFGALIMFRTRSIWTFTYSADPAFGAQQQTVAGIGLSDPQAITVFEGIIYFLSGTKAYSLNGATATQLNQDVAFTTAQRVGCYLPYAVSAVGRRIIFSYFDTLYVYNLQSRVWTTWNSAEYPGLGKFVQQTDSGSGDLTTYVAHSNFNSSTETIYFTDGITDEYESQPFQVFMQTKNYDYGTSDHYKRLYWWGADVVTRTSLTATAIPVVYSQRVTWGQMLAMTWGQALAHTWGQPQVGGVSQETVIRQEQLGGPAGRKFLRFGKSLRFPSINYQIKALLDGSNATGPMKIFHITTVIDIRQLVSKTVS